MMPYQYIIDRLLQAYGKPHKAYNTYYEGLDDFDTCMYHIATLSLVFKREEKFLVNDFLVMSSIVLKSAGEPIFKYQAKSIVFKARRDRNLGLSNSDFVHAFKYYTERILPLVACFKISNDFPEIASTVFATQPFDELYIRHPISELANFEIFETMRTKREYINAGIIYSGVDNMLNAVINVRNSWDNI